MSEFKLIRRPVREQLTLMGLDPKAVLRDLLTGPEWEGLGEALRDGIESIEADARVYEANSSWLPADEILKLKKWRGYCSILRKLAAALERKEGE